jgi:PTS system cellobiose-specific IIA component
MVDSKSAAAATEEVAFQLIAHAGEARSCVFDALNKALAEDWAGVESCLQSSSDHLVEAQKVHMTLLQKEARGESVAPSILLVHAQDILMAAMTEKDLSEKIIELHRALLSKGITPTPTKRANCKALPGK